MLQSFNVSRESYLAAQPFPHCVMDGVFPDEPLRQVLKEIEADQIDLETEMYATHFKGRKSDLEAMKPAVRALIEYMNSGTFLKLLERLTGIDGLIADPTLEGAGVHQIRSGGFLKIHTDFNWHRRLKLHRRVNVLLYLNENWQEEWNGCLELWRESDILKPDGKPGARIAPIFNRMAIFNTTDFSFHGHPDPLQCPQNVRRNSIALYYYTKDRPPEETRSGVTKMTDYRERNSEVFGLKHKLHQALIGFPALRKLLGR